MNLRVETIIMRKNEKENYDKEETKISWNICIN